MKIKEKLGKLFNCLFVNDYKCIICNREIQKDSRYSICQHCFDNLPTITKSCSKCGARIVSGKICLNCKTTLPLIEKSYAVFEYISPITNLVYRLKFNNERYLAKYLGNFLVDYYKNKKLKVDYIIPVPLNFIRLKERKFNQVELLCENFKDINVEVKCNVVERIVNTPHQTTLTREQRLKNVKGAFRVIDKALVKDKTILIVDDVYTTGATINEIAEVLYNAKAKKVYALTLAHTTDNRILNVKESKW